MTRVPPQWPSERPCKIAFVGEAPGDEEVYARPPQPFVGPAGRVFNSALRAANLTRSDYLITNVFDTKADDNDCGPWIRDPLVYEPAFKRLAEELDQCQPNVVVPLGGTALWALTTYTGIQQFRGAVTRASRVREGAKLLPSLHPAAVLRQWKWLPLMVGDFIKAAAEAEKGPGITYPKVRLHVEPNLNEVVDFLHECSHSDLLSVDIETGWGLITCIGFAPTADMAMCVPFVDLSKPDKSYWDPEDEARAWRAVRSLLESPCPKLMQNGLYDCFWLTSYGIRVANYRHDTRLMHHALYPELPKDLASMAANYTNIGSWKHMSRDHGEKKDA